MDDQTKNDELPVLTLTPDDMTRVFRGLKRTRIFEAIRKGKLRAKKDGKVTIITIEEGRRYVESLPDREPNEAAEAEHDTPTAA